MKCLAAIFSAVSNRCVNAHGNKVDFKKFMKLLFTKQEFEHATGAQLTTKPQ